MYKARNTKMMNLSEYSYVVELEHRRHTKTTV